MKAVDRFVHSAKLWGL